MNLASVGYTARRGRLKGIEIKSGAVRQARLEAGLSLAGVAGDDITRAAIHLIETGKSRPSMPTLELISRRTGKPLSYFLNLEGGAAGVTSVQDARLLAVETLVESSRLAEAIAAAEELLPGNFDNWNLARIHYWIGQAQARLRQSDPAIDHLRKARDLFEQLNDEWLAVECLDWEAASLYLEHDPSALSTAERALDRCRQLEPRNTATEARILSHIAAIHNQRYDWDSAIKCFQAALELSDQVRDLGRMARMYEGLGHSYSGIGRQDQALGFAHRALAIYSTLQDRVSVAGIENNLGLALLRMGEVQSAEVQLRAAMHHFNELSISAGLSHVMLSLAELELTRGDDDEADRLCREAMTLATEHGERLSIGLGHQFLGQIGARRGEVDESDRNFALAIITFTEEDASERLIDCYSAYAQALEGRGDTRGALEQTKLALAVHRPSLVPHATSKESREVSTG